MSSTPVIADKNASDNVKAVKRGRSRKTNRQGSETVDEITENARNILINEGPDRFTLERVAKAAGITKGTLLYHFHDKDQLIEHLMEEYLKRLEQRFEDGCRQAEEKGLEGNDAVTAGFAQWYRRFRKEDINSTSLGLLLLSMATHNESLHEKANRWYNSIFEKLAGGHNNALIAVLAIEGLFYLRHFHIDVINDERIDGVLNDIVSLTKVDGS